MLNPNSADAQVNDPTITRCINFAKSWGYGRLELVNMFAYRTSKPSLLKQATEPIGSDNDAFGQLRNRFILESVEKCDRVILAWGNHSDLTLDIYDRDGDLYNSYSVGSGSPVGFSFGGDTFTMEITPSNTNVLTEYSLSLNLGQVYDPD